MHFYCSVPCRCASAGIIDTQRVHIQQVPVKCKDEWGSWKHAENKYLTLICNKGITITCNYKEEPGSWWHYICWKLETCFNIIYKQDLSIFQDDLDCLYEWSIINPREFNAEKCKVLRITRKISSLSWIQCFLMMRLCLSSRGDRWQERYGRPEKGGQEARFIRCKNSKSICWCWHGSCVVTSLRALCSPLNFCHAAHSMEELTTSSKRKRSLRSSSSSTKSCSPTKKCSKSNKADLRRAKFKVRSNKKHFSLCQKCWITQTV